MNSLKGVHKILKGHQYDYSWEILLHLIKYWFSEIPPPARVPISLDGFCFLKFAPSRSCRVMLFFLFSKPWFDKCYSLALV